MLKSETRRNRVTFLVNDKELEELKKKASNEDMVVSDYIRDRTLYTVTNKLINSLSSYGQSASEASEAMNKFGHDYYRDTKDLEGEVK